MSVSTGFMPAVFRWASGEDDWSAIVEESFGGHEGDLIRAMRRLIDVLRQLAESPEVDAGGGRACWPGGPGDRSRHRAGVRADLRGRRPLADIMRPTMMRIAMCRLIRTSSRLAAVALLTTACSGDRADVLERTDRGPRAEEIFIMPVVRRSTAGSPTSTRSGVWQDQMDEKVFKYLREHPELEQPSRYSEFRFWRQVTNGSTPGEVSVLLDEPRERPSTPP